MFLIGLYGISLFVGGETKSASMEKDNFSASSHGNGLGVYFFYGRGCPHCANVEPFIAEMKRNYTIQLRKYDIYSNRSCLPLFDEYSNMYGIPLGERGVPTVFVSDTYFVGGSSILNGFEEAVKKALRESSPVEKTLEADSSESLDMETISVAGGVSIVAVTVAALVDAISPCSIAILIFLIGARVLVANRRKRALNVGLAFCLSVFVAYFLFGLGLLTVVQVSGFSSIFSLLVGLVAVLAGIFYLKDVFWYGKGGFTMEVPRSLKPLLMKLLKGVSSPFGAFVMGFVVVCFELPCTGGPYLFILGQLANSATRLQTVPFLLYYNFIFVLPLIVISLFLYSNLLSIGKVRVWNEKNKRLLRLVGGSAMMALGLLAIPVSQVLELIQAFLCSFKVIGLPMLVIMLFYFVVSFVKRKNLDSRFVRLPGRGILLIALIATPVFIVSSPVNLSAGQSDVVSDMVRCKDANRIAGSLDFLIEDALNSGKLVFLYFYLEECGYCRLQKPVIDELERRFSNKVVFIRVNGNENREATKEFGVSGFPTMLLILNKTTNGYEYRDFRGFTEKTLLKESIDRVGSNEEVQVVTTESTWQPDLVTGKMARPKLSPSTDIPGVVPAQTPQPPSCEDPNLHALLGDTWVNGDMYLAHGSYTVTDTIDPTDPHSSPGVIIVNASEIIIDCCGSTIISDTGYFYYRDHVIIGETVGIYNGGTPLGHSGVTIRNCNIMNFSWGINVWQNSPNNIIDNNNIANVRAAGIRVDNSPGPIITDNTVLGPFMEGILVGGSNNAFIDGNTVNYGTTSHGYGIAVSYTNYARITNNNLPAIFRGIDLHGSNYNTITGNTVHSSDQDYGIYLTNSDNNLINRNNLNDGIYLNANSNNNRGCNTGRIDEEVENENIYLTNDSQACYLWGCEILDGIYSNGSYILAQNISEHVGTCFTFGASNLDLNCRGRTIDGDDTSEVDYGIYLNGQSSNTIRDCVVTDFFHGILLNHADSNTINSNMLVDNTEDGIWLYENCRNNNIFDNNASNNGYYGISIRASDSNIITNNTVTGNAIDGGYAGIYLQFGSTNNTINNNKVESNNNDGIRAYASNRNTLANNDISSNSDDGIELNCSHRNTIINNTITSNAWGIYVPISEYNTITNNNISLNLVDGIYLRQSEHNSISDNAINRNLFDGIWMRFSSNNTMTDNNVSLNLDDGFDLDQTIENTIANNNITFNLFGSGVTMEFSSNNTITQNIVSSNGWDGIGLWTSPNNTISNNDITLSLDDGIDVWHSSYNIIANNNMSSNSNNGIGICSNSSFNIIDNNLIKNNTRGLSLIDCRATYWGDYLCLDPDIPPDFEEDRNLNNTIRNNRIFNNAEDGIYLDGSFSQIENNIISNNGYGVHLTAIAEELAGGIRVNTGTYRTVYFSFGFEAINATADRNYVMNETVFWLDPTPSTVLLVDDDGVDSYETYFWDPLIANGISYDYWNVSAQGSPTYSNLNAYSVVIWFTGNELDGTLTAGDQSNLTNYLDNGGSLFVTGQDIGFDIGDTPFYSDYLHARYIRDDASMYTLFGVSGDPISEGLTIGISGGDGANNQNWPSVIRPIEPASIVFYYGMAGISPDVDLSSINNNLIFSNEIGIRLEDSNNTEISSNIVRSNNQGIVLYGCNRITIYHNDIVDNTIQAIDDGTNGINTWDDGYPSGGNYWSDYTGEDFYWGPYQNETGSDGIGDAPYVIDADSRDRYPPMNPWRWGPVLKIRPRLIRNRDLSVETFTIDIYVSEVTDLYAYSFTLDYAPYASVLAAVSVTEGPFLEQGGETYFDYTMDHFRGEIKVGCTLVGAVPGVDGSGTIVSISFRVVEAGESPLELRGTELINSRLQPIPHPIPSKSRYVGPTVELVRMRLASRSMTVGETQTFTGRIRNTGDVPLYAKVKFDNIRVEDGARFTFYAGQSFSTTPREPEYLYVDGFDFTWTEWIPHGVPPYLNRTEDGNYVEGPMVDGALIGWFTFEDIDLAGATIKRVLLEGYTNGPHNEAVDFDVYNGSFAWIGSLYATGDWAWVEPRWVDSAPASEMDPSLLTEEGVNNFTILLHFYDPDGVSVPGNIIDCIRLKVEFSPTSPPDPPVYVIQPGEVLELDPATWILASRDIGTYAVTCTVTYTHYEFVWNQGIRAQTRRWRVRE